MAPSIEAVSVGGRCAESLEVTGSAKAAANSALTLDGIERPLNGGANANQAPDRTIASRKARSVLAPIAGSNKVSHLPQQRRQSGEQTVSESDEFVKHPIATSYQRDPDTDHLGNE